MDEHSPKKVLVWIVRLCMFYLSNRDFDYLLTPEQ